jgi:hypothetical protein
MTVDMQFESERSGEIAAQGADAELAARSIDWLVKTTRHKYSYHFKSLGSPIIQYPDDIVMMQELIWSTQPDVIVETGIARGGSLILSAAMLTLLDYCDAATAGQGIDPCRLRRRVIGIDIDIRSHNRAAIERHPLGVTIGMHVHIASHCYIAGSDGLAMDDFSGLAAGVLIFTSSDDCTGKKLANPTLPRSAVQRTDPSRQARYRGCGHCDPTGCDYRAGASVGAQHSSSDR